MITVQSGDKLSVNVKKTKCILSGQEQIGNLIIEQVNETHMLNQ